MIKGEDVLEDILKFNGFWKSSLKDKAKWLVVWLFVVFFIVFNLIGMVIQTPISLIQRLFRKK